MNELLEETEDDDVIGFLEDAIDNLNFSEEMNDFGFLEVDPENTQPQVIDFDDEEDQKGKTKKKKH